MRAAIGALVEHLQAKEGRATYTGESRMNLPISCRRAQCRCTHTWPCEAGWIEAQVNGMVQVQACPNCRPEVRAVALVAEGDRDRFQIAVRDAAAREAATSAHAWD